MINLLSNGTFEADWSDHRCLVLHPAEPYLEFRDIGNIFNPSEWTTWFLHVPGTWDQPEVRDLHKSITPERVRSGEKAILLFTFGRKHVAGFYQQVQVEPGARLRLSAYAHAWSNHKDKAFPDLFPHPDDGLWSEGAGYAPRHPQEGQQHVWLEGETQNDHLRNFTFYVSIDPAGGINPFGPSVVRGRGAHIYNAYAEVPPVEAVAQSDTVTVFLHSKTLWPFKHNDAHWDDASLVVVGSEPPPGECRGTPRVQYERTCVLLPPDADDEWAHAAVAGSWNAYRFSIGSSADDSGLGDLDDKRVVAVNPHRWPSDLGDFFKTWYPGTEYVPLSPVSPDNLEGMLANLDGAPGWIDPTLELSQLHPDWKNAPIPGTCGGTIGRWGCWATDLAVALRHYGIKADATPLDVVTTLGSDGFNDCYIRWSAIEEAYGLDVGTINEGEALARIALGEIILCEVQGMEHFVACTGMDGDGRVICVDPLRGDTVPLRDRYAPESWRKLGLAETPPPPPPPPPHEGPLPPEGAGRISIHWQGRAQGDIEFVEQVQPAVAKTVLNIEFCREFKRVSPQTVTVFRQWRPDQGEFIKRPNGPREWLETFLDALHANADVVDYVESLNEMYATGDVDGIQRNVDFDVRFCEELQKEGYPARPCVLNAAVGNPQHGPETELLVPAARASVEHGGVLGYHAYWGSRPDGYCTMDDAFMHYAGRALLSWDPVFKAAGIQPYYILGESGAVHISPQGWMNPNAGWKDACRSFDHYIEWILEFKRRLDEWNVVNNYRVLGATLFTLNGGSQWQRFELTGYLDRLAEALT